MRKDLQRRHVIDVRELLDRQDQQGGAAAGDLPGDARHPLRGDGKAIHGHVRAPGLHAREESRHHERVLVAVHQHRRTRFDAPRDGERQRLGERPELPICEVRARRDAHRLGIRSLKRRLLDQFQVSHGNLQMSRWAEPLGVPAHGAARTKARERPVPSDAAAKSLPPPDAHLARGGYGGPRIAPIVPPRPLSKTYRTVTLL